MTNKRILITGASDGIGKEIAVRLAKDGHSLILCGRDEKKLKAVNNLCGGNQIILDFDINDHIKLNKQLDSIDRLDALINNAGIWQKLGDLESISDEKIIEIINTNLISQIILTKKLIPRLIESKGHILNIISKSGISAQEGQSVYTASKYGMRGFTDAMRQDLKRKNVRVSAVYQSGTNTQMFTKTGDNLPVDTFTEPEDLADLVAYIINAPKKMVIHEVRVDKY
ncbi:MAG: SDR family oxidoreductase [Candidatus Saccharimonadales bacterium]|jgi:short-subunit dehydrogenase